MRALENAAGNFYINDKPTGAVVGQQPFGGARIGNQRQGRILPQPPSLGQPADIKETLSPPTDYCYPFHQA